MMAAPFRVRSLKTITDDRGGAEPEQKGDPWLTRLVKLVPSEVIAVYLAGVELAKTWLGIWAFICLLLVFVARTLGTKEQGKPIQWVAVLVSIISFVIWIYATGGEFFNLKLPPDKGIASIAVLLWTFLVPYFYKGD
jgi:energy-coupling factor transporter transmembrane protein EcfT